jgi:hypothetical protein
MFNKSYKILICSGLMGVTSWLSIKFLDIFILDTTHVIPVLTLMAISSLVGLVTYIFSIKLFKIEEINDYQKYFLKFKDFIFSR